MNIVEQLNKWESVKHFLRSCYHGLEHDQLEHLMEEHRQVCNLLFMLGHQSHDVLRRARLRFLTSGEYELLEFLDGTSKFRIEDGNVLEGYCVVFEDTKKYY